jgi:hypothetical protein
LHFRFETTGYLAAHGSSFGNTLNNATKWKIVEEAIADIDDDRDTDFDDVDDFAAVLQGGLLAIVPLQV